MLTIKYKDENDRAMGVAGMAMCLVIWENGRYIDRLSVDAPVGQAVTMTPDFYPARNPLLSAKAVWSREVELFQTEAGMVIANLAARAALEAREPLSRELREALLRHLADLGGERCGLEEAEVRAISDKITGYFTQVLQHPAVAGMVADFARQLTIERQMDRARVMELLGRLEGI